MAQENRRLREVMEYLGISNLALAKALRMDPSAISRYLSGQRRLAAASPQMSALADYLLAQSQQMRDAEWLKARFTEAGLPTDAATVHRFKQNLIMYLATDGAALRENLGRTLPGDIAGAGGDIAAAAAPPEGGGDVRVGRLQTVFLLRDALFALPDGAQVRLFLSSDRVSTVIQPDFANALLRAAAAKRMNVSVVACVSGDTRAVHRLLDAYMAGLVSGQVRLSVVRGVTQPVTGMTHIFLPDGACILINETMGDSAPPISLLVREEAFVREAFGNFTAAERYAQSVLSVYGDECTREMIEILAVEYCAPGGLDVVKDSVNPMFMTRAAYDRFLRACGHTEAEFAWRSAEFARFKAGMDANLQSGAPFREVLSLARLNDIALRGGCRMAGLYFAQRGYVEMDRQGCADVLAGYAAYLEAVPAFQLLILDELSELHGNNCWHVKRDGHVTVNNWQGSAPVMVYSDQLMLLREFQTRFEALWARGAGGVGSRANVIHILRDVEKRLRA